MLKALIAKAVKVVDDAGVETVLTLVFVAQVSAFALPVQTLADLDVDRLATESEIVEVGTTVLQMPAKPKARVPRTVGRDQEGQARGGTGAAPSKAARVRRPEPVDENLGSEELDQLRAMESSVRVTVIGPDGQPRTKIVRLSGSRDGTAAPARRPHD
jgi:hypothetical protein